MRNDGVPAHTITLVHAGAWIVPSSRPVSGWYSLYSPRNLVPFVAPFRTRVALFSCASRRFWQCLSCFRAFPLRVQTQAYTLYKKMVFWNLDAQGAVTGNDREGGGSVSQAYLATFKEDTVNAFAQLQSVLQ